MTFDTLISADELATQLDQCVVVDCRHDLFDPLAGRRAYEAAHLPGAHFLHLDEDLAGPAGARTGRHPLPARERLCARLVAIGLGPHTQLVAYDAAGGSTASRLWWLARWIGHRAVAVLDGGLPAWQRAGYPLSAEPASTATRTDLRAGQALARAIEIGAIERNLVTRELQIIDARSEDRFRGDTEPIDPVAGHIPGSMNRPLQRNLRPDGRFLPPEVLRQEFNALLGARSPEQIVHSCGSGVSACHNLLAMEAAGLQGSMLYAGSWSQWCSDSARPIATGETH